MIGAPAKAVPLLRIVLPKDKRPVADESGVNRTAFSAIPPNHHNLYHTQRASATREIKREFQFFTRRYGFSREQVI